MQDRGRSHWVLLGHGLRESNTITVVAMVYPGVPNVRNRSWEWWAQYTPHTSRQDTKMRFPGFQPKLVSGGPNKKSANKSLKRVIFYYFSRINITINLSSRQFIEFLAVPKF